MMRRIPFVPTPIPIVHRMLELAGVEKGELVVDLGAGDGRILVEAVRRFEARGLGVENNPKRVALAARRIERSGVEDKALVVQADLFKADLREADVVTLYLLPEANLALLPKLRSELKPTARVVAHDFGIPGVEPKARLRLNHNGLFHYVYLYDRESLLKPKRF